MGLVSPAIGRLAFPAFSGVACAHVVYVRKIPLISLRLSLQDERSLLSLRGRMRLARRRYRLRVRTWPSQGQNPGSNPGIATNPAFMCRSRDGVTGAGLRTSINVVRSIHTN